MLNKNKLNKKTISLFVVVTTSLALLLLNVDSEPTDIQVYGSASVTTNLASNINPASNTSPNSAPKVVTQDVAPSETEVSMSSLVEEENNEISNLPMSPIERIRAIQEKTPLHESILKDHENFSRYPSYNQKIQNIEKDPTKQRYEVDERTTQSKDAESALTVWSNQKFYLRGDQVTVYAILQDGKGQRITTTFAGQLIFNERENIQTFMFQDEDQDGIYETHFTLDQVNNKTLVGGVYKLLIVNQTNELADAVAFILSEPEVQLTGNYRDNITAQGNLLIEAEVEVTSKNRFYLQGSLYSSTNDPIGTTQYSADLDTGRHWLPLEFYGLMVRDAGEPGPYLLKHLSLAKVTLPMQRAPLSTPEYFTQNYTLDQFNQSSYAAAH